MTETSNPTDENSTVDLPLIEWDINKAAIEEVAEELKDIDAYKDLDAAKAGKKKLVKMRTTLSDAHKETKAEALAFGRKVDAKKNEYLVLIKEIEDPISEQLDEIKNAAAVKEEARIAKIMSHIERIQAFALDRHSLTIAELEERLETLRTVEIEVEVLEEYAEDAQLAKEEADLKLRLAIDREKTEQKERTEKKELERKNAELQAELEESRKANEERNRKAIEYRAEQEHKQREEQAEQQRALDDQQAEIDKQNKEREDAEQAEHDRVAKEEADAEAQKLKDLQAPDVDKLSKYADAIDHLIGLKPVMGSTAGNAVILQAVSVMIEVVYDIRKSTEEMK